MLRRLACEAICRLPTVLLLMLEAVTTNLVHHQLASLPQNLQLSTSWAGRLTHLWVTGGRRTAKTDIESPNVSSIGPDGLHEIWHDGRRLLRKGSHAAAATGFSGHFGFSVQGRFTRRMTERVRIALRRARGLHRTQPGGAGNVAGMFLGDLGLQTRRLSGYILRKPGRCGGDERRGTKCDDRYPHFFSPLGICRAS